MRTLFSFSLASVFILGCSSEKPAHRRPADPTGAYYAVDPVTEVPVVTDSAWETYWNGNSYFFDSEGNLKKFQAEPTAFVTEQGWIKWSHDPVTNGEVRRNTPWNSQYRDNRFYFQSEASMKKFNAYPELYVAEEARPPQVIHPLYPHGAH